MGSLLEFEGKNVALAVEAASRALNIPKDLIDYTVVSHGSSGIFGLVGTKKARITVSPPEPSVNAGVERIIESTLGGGDSRSDLPKKGQNVEEVGAAYRQTVTENEPDEDPAEVGVEALQQIIDTITSGAEITVTQKHKRIFFQVEGGNPALLIGKRGQTLDAIQFIVEKIINKSQKNRVRIQVDVGGYLEKRKANLRELALRTAEKASRSGKPCTIGQMNAHDRRIIHLALKNDKRIRTQSMGNGSLRKLVIFPKKNAFKKK